VFDPQKRHLMFCFVSYTCLMRFCHFCVEIGCWESGNGGVWL
jgi:hypothetical protein